MAPKLNNKNGLLSSFVLAPKTLSNTLYKQIREITRTKQLAKLALISASAAASTGVFAQSESNSLVLEELIVTAQKREQNLQEVPISVAAFDNEFLEQANIDDILELQFFTPGLQTLITGNIGATSIAIRGLGTTGGGVSLESAVGIYVDGVYRARQSSAISDLIDLERVEVLKGPQGTLFGRNTISGAIQYISVAPQPEFEGWVEVQAGNLDHKNIKGAINIPISDTLSTRFSGNWSERDGFVDNLLTGTETHNRDRHQLRAQALFTPTDDISFRLIADYSKLDEKCCAIGITYDGPTNQILSGLGLSVSADRFDNDEYIANFDSAAEIEEWGVSGELKWDINEDMTLTSITAIRSYELESLVDADAIATEIVYAGNDTDQESFSQELRVNGNFNEKIEYVAGVYYFEQSLDDTDILFSGIDATTFLFGGPFTLAQAVAGGLYDPLYPIGSNCTTDLPSVFTAACSQLLLPEDEGSSDISEQDHQSWAVFAQAEYFFSEQLVATLGLRYNEEEKELDARFVESGAFPGFLRSPFYTPVTPDQNGIKFEDEEVSGTAKLTYFWTPEIMTYISYGRGYKAGGTNTARLAVTPASAIAASVEYLLTGSTNGGETAVPAVFSPETSESWEIGMKGDFFDNRIRLNAAIFQTEFEDLQQNIQINQTTALGNAGKVTSEGVELELQAVVTEWLNLTSSVAYLNAKYDEFEGGACIRTGADAIPPTIQTCDATDNRVQGIPQWSWTGSARVNQPINNDWTGFGQLDIRWEDETFYGSENDPNKTVDPYTLVNLSFGAMTSDGDLTVTFWGKNIFDEDYPIVPLGGGAIRPGSVIATHSEPRTYGVSINRKF